MVKGQIHRAIWELFCQIHLTLKGIRLVLDTANGAAYKVAPAVFSELGADVMVINDKPHGSND